MALTGNIICMVIFVQEGVSIESDCLVSDSVGAEKVPDGFGDQKDNLKIT